MRSTRLHLLLCLLLAVSFQVGCGGRLGLDEPMTLDVRGPIEVHVESFNGDVFITADETVREPSVRVKRQATHGLLRAAEADASMEQIDYRVDVVPGELGQRLKVETWTEHGEPHFHRAHVHITVPEIDGVYVRTTNGRVYLKGIEGTIDVVTTNGDVRILSNRPLTKAVTARNNGGNIDYRVRGESTGRFEAEAVHGRVFYRARYGRFTVEPGTNERRLLGRLNDGENLIDLKVRHGDIRIHVVHNPEQVGHFIIE